MGSTQPSKAEADVPGIAQPLSQELLTQALNLFAAPPTVPERQILGFSPQEQADISGLRGQLGVTAPSVQAAGPFLQSLFTGAAADPTQNPVLQAQINALTQASQQAFAPQLDIISSQFAGAGVPTGSAAATAATRAGLASQQNLQQTIASLLFGTQQATQQLGVQALPQALALQQDPLQRLQASLQLGGFERGLAQSQQDVGIENAIRQLQFTQFPFQIAAGALGALPLGTPQFGPSPLQQNLALAKGGIDILAGLKGLFPSKGGGGGGSLDLGGN